MTKILVFTDAHFCVNDGSLEFARTRFEAGLEHAQKYHGDAQLLVVTGDLTNEGDIASFEAFAQSMKKCNLPNVLMVGNHDRRENFLTVFPNAITDENGFVQQAINMPHAKLVFLDTLFAPPYDYPKSHAGFLCDERLGWLEQELKTAGDQQVVIFMHHPPITSGFKGMDIIRLQNHEAFYDLLEKYNNVSQIIAGHIHRTISGSHRGTPFAVFKSTQYQMPMLLDVPRTDVEVDEPPAYGILLIQEKGVIVHTEDFGLTDYEAL